MGVIYWDNEEIPIPPEGYINHNGNLVFVYADDGPRRQSKRIIIGRAVSETMMHPNSNYKMLYRSEWKKHYGEEVPESPIVRPGIYAAVLGIVYALGLYAILRKALRSTSFSNAVLDYSIYSMLYQTDVSMHYEEKMEEQILFSREMHGDSWLSDFFTNKLTAGRILAFRTLWLEECKARGITKCWICTDGSNTDCAAAVPSAEKGKAKSGKEVNIISYIWAVAEDGTPIAFAVNRGSMVDCKAIAELIALLMEYGIVCEGVVLDRGFCTADVLRQLKEAHLDYVMMLKGDSAAHRWMYDRHGKDLAWNVEYAISSDPMFGMSERGRVLKDSQEEAYLSLFFDGANCSGRKGDIVTKVFEAREKMLEVAASGEKPAVPAGMGKYLSVRWRGRHWEVLTHTQAWQDEVDSRGFSCMASSKNLGAAAVNAVYNLRDVSEKTFTTLKAGLGLVSLRMHSEPGIMGKFLVLFVTNIIRNEFQKKCRENGYSTNKMMAELNKMKMIQFTEGSYTFIRNMSERQQTILAQWDILPEDFDSIAADYNRRISGAPVSQIRQKPPHDTKARRKPGRKKHVPDDPPVEVTTTLPKRKRGRPAGSSKKEKDKKPSGKKIGRPLGSKNKKTLLKEAEMKATGIIPVKRGKGRPKGSKDSKPRKRRGSGTSNEAS